MYATPDAQLVEGDEAQQLVDALDQTKQQTKQHRKQQTKQNVHNPQQKRPCSVPKAHICMGQLETHTCPIHAMTRTSNATAVSAMQCNRPVGITGI